MITASANYVLFEGSEVRYASTSIRVDFEYNAQQETFRCKVQAVGAAAAAPEIGSYGYILTKAQVDAKTGTGTETEAVLKAVELCIIDILDAITENTTPTNITFTN